MNENNMPTKEDVKILLEKISHQIKTTHSRITRKLVD